MAETPLLWRGEMTTRRALTGRGLGFLSPGMLWLIGFLVLGEVPSLAQLAGFAIVLVSFRLTQKG